MRRYTLNCLQHAHTPLMACVRVKDKRMPSCWWDRIQADYRGEIRSLRHADPVFYLWKTGGCMNQQDGKIWWTVSECRDGKGPPKQTFTLAIRSVGVQMMQMGSGQSEATCRNSFRTHRRAQTGPRPWLLWHLLVNWEHQKDCVLLMVKKVLQKLADSACLIEFKSHFQRFSNSTKRKIMASCHFQWCSNKTVHLFDILWLHESMDVKVEKQTKQTYFFELFLLWFRILIAVIIFITTKTARKRSDVILRSCELTNKFLEKTYSSSSSSSSLSSSSSSESIFSFFYTWFRI